MARVEGARLMTFGSFDGLVDCIGLVIIIGAFLWAGFAINKDARR